MAAVSHENIITSLSPYVPVRRYIIITVRNVKGNANSKPGKNCIGLDSKPQLLLI